MNESTQSNNNDSLLGEVAGEFFDRLARGENPNPIEYAKAYPQIADHILRVFPAMRVVDDLSLEASAFAGGSATDDIRQLGDFRIQREIGRGGMGVVYEAEQLSMGRMVALKILPFVALVDDKPLQRFRNEVRAAATLQHPNIVPVYSVGEERGVHYYAMQLIRGQTLAEVINQLATLRRDQPLDGSSISKILALTSAPSSSSTDRPISPTKPVDDVGDVADETGSQRPSSSRATLADVQFYRGVAKLGVQSARALQHAHEQGVVHRDIKPGNLMLDTDGQLWITDFGLARIEADPGVTMTGDVVGTLRYMSPEQALGRRTVVDSRADVYSLAATLYELCALRPVFDGFSRREILEQIAFQDPIPMQQLDPHVPRELDTILLKGLARTPDQRFESAAEMADDLQRFLDDVPIKARRPTLVQRTAKWAARNRSLVTASLLGCMAVLLTAVVGTVSSLWFAWDADASRDLAEQRLKASRLAQQKAEEQRQAAESAMRQAQSLLYISDMQRASNAFNLGDIRRVSTLLERHVPGDGEEDRRDFAWYYLNQLVTRRPFWRSNLDSPVHATCGSPDGRLVAASTADRRIRIFDMVAGRLVQSYETTTEIRAVDWSPDGQRIAGAGEDGRIYIWQAPQSSDIAVQPGAENVAQQTLDSAADSWKPLNEFRAHEGIAKGVCFSPAGDTLVSCGDDAAIRSWDSDTGQEKNAFLGHDREVEAIAVSPNGATLASASSDHQIGIWNLRTGDCRELRKITGGRLVCIAISRSGAFWAAGDNGGKLIVGETATGKKVPLNLVDGVESVSFIGPSGHVFAGNRAGSINVVSVNYRNGDLHLRREHLPNWQAHQGRVMTLTPTAHGNRIISGSRDGWLSAWPVDLDYLVRAKFRAFDFDVTHEGKILVCHHDIRELDLNRRTAKTVHFANHGAWERIAAASQSSRIAVTGGSIVAVYDSQKQVELGRWDFDRDAHVIAISPSGRFVAVADWNDREVVDIFDVEQPDARRQVPARQCNCVAFSPDGRWLAAGEMDDLLIYDVATWQQSQRLAGHDSTLSDCAFSPVGDRLATVSYDRRLKLWDVETGDLLHTCAASLFPLESVEYSHDGRLMVTGCDGNKVRVWDARTAQPVVDILVDADSRQVHFSRSDREIIVRGNDDSIIITGVDQRPDQLSSDRRQLPQPNRQLTVLADVVAVSKLPIRGISADGSVVVGNLVSAAGNRPFYWSRNTGTVRLRVPKEFKSAQAMAVDAAGKRIAGRFIPPSGKTRSGYWPSHDRLPVVAPPYESYPRLCADQISKAGICGYAVERKTNRRQAFVFDGGQLLELPGFEKWRNTTANYISPDGALVIGNAYSRPGYLRSREVKDLQVMSWHDGVPTPLPGFGDNSHNWRVTDVSADGSVVVGCHWAPGRHPGERGFAFRWERGHVEILGDLPGGKSVSFPEAVSDDGRIVCGRASMQAGSIAFIWDAVHGMRPLEHVLQQNGYNLRGWTLYDAPAASYDGSYIACAARDPQGTRRAVLAYIPPEALAE